MKQGAAVSNLPSDQYMMRKASDLATPPLGQRLPTPGERYEAKTAGTRALVDSAYLQLHADHVGQQPQGIQEHISILEEQLKAIANRQSYLVEEERANRLRVEGTLKIANEQTALVVNDLASKVASFEAALSRESDDSSELLSKVFLVHTTRNVASTIRAK